MANNPLSHDELETYFALVTAGDLIQRAVAAQLAEHALSPLPFSILASLLDAKDGLRMSDLAESLVISRSRLTYQVTQLEKAGLVVRSSSVGDNRGVVARLSDNGRDLVLQTLPGHVTLVRTYFLDLIDRDQIDSLRATLQNLVAHLRGTTEPE